MIFLYADVETTGLNPNESSIFQIAGRFSKRGKSLDFNYKFRPYRGEIITGQASKKTGYTSEDLDSFPDQSPFFDEFIKNLEDFTNSKEEKIYLVGYNASFDMDFIRSWFLYNENPDFSKYFYFPCIDVMYLAAFALMGERKYIKNFQLSTVYNYLTDKTLAGAHNAFNDINATIEMLNIITRKLRGIENGS